MKILITEVPEKYPKLILRFEKETGWNAIYHNKLTKNFKYWFHQKIKNKTLICNICDRVFDSKRALISHKWSHNKKLREEANKKIGDTHRGKTRNPFTEEHKRKIGDTRKGKHHSEATKQKIGDRNRGKYRSEEIKKKMSIIQKEIHNRPEVREKHSKSMKEQWNIPEFRKRMSGKNHPNYGKRGKETGMFGKRGKETGNWKGDDVGYHGLHQRVRKIKIKPENCEICGLPEFYENLGRLELSNIRNHQYTDNPDDYQYVHQRCHRKYDS